MRQTVVVAVFLIIIIISIGLLALSAVSLTYIEETKDKITNKNISLAMVQTSEAGTALALIVAFIMFLSAIYFVRQVRK